MSTGAPRGAPVFFLSLDCQKNNDGETDCHASSGRQHLPAVASWPIDSGGAALRNQRGVIFRGRRKGATHRGASARGESFKRNPLVDDVVITESTEHAAMLARIW